MTEITQKIPARLKSGVVGGYVTGAADIYDDAKSKDQASINADVDTAIGDDNTEGTIKGRIKDLETLVGNTPVDTQIDNKINALDATVSQTAGTDGLSLSVTEADGKVTAVSGSIAANTYDSYGSAATAKSEVIGDAGTAYNTLGKLEDKIQQEASDRASAITSAINALDETKSQTAGADGLALSITQTDGKIASISGSIASGTYDDYGAADTAKTQLLGDAGTSYDTLGKLEDAVQSEATARSDGDTAINNAIGTDTTSGTVKGRIKALEDAMGTGGSVDSKIAAAKSEIIGDAATDYNTLGKLEDKIQAEATARGNEDTAIDGRLDTLETAVGTGGSVDTRIATAKSEIIGDAATAYNTLGKLEDKLQEEATARGNADTALDGRLDTVEGLIPAQATATNQLADKDFVNSSISTATATYRGSKNSVSDLNLSVDATHTQIEAALATAITTADNNDYCFVHIPTSASSPTEIGRVERYKYDGDSWEFEYALNNSGFTSEQWASLNSGITSGLVTAFGNKYDLPSTGIPKTDLASAVQTSLGKADTALQAADITGKAEKSEMTVTAGTGADADKTTITLKTGTSATVLTAHQDITGKADKTSTVSSVDYDTTLKKITKTVNGTSSDVITVATLKTDMGLSNVSDIDQSKAVKSFSVSGGTVTYTCLDNTTGTFTLPTFIASGSTAAPGLVPAPSTTAGTTKFLREDGTWVKPEGEVYTAGEGIDITDNEISLSGDVALFDEYDSSAVLPDFDAYLDTVHVTSQTLTDAQKTQARTNIGAMGASDSLSDISYSNGKLYKTKDSVNTEVCDVVTSGFQIQYNETTGITSFAPVGSATAAFDTTTGITAFTY